MTGATTQRLLILAQLLVLVSLTLALLFLYNTTGATLTLFATVAPFLAILALLILLWVFLERFRQRHHLFHFKTYEPGQEVFREGERGDCVYFIRSGAVEVVRKADEGEKVVAKLSDGQYFGEMALLSDQPRNATVRTVTETELAVLGKHNFVTMLQVMPETEEDILKTIQARAMGQTK